MAVHGVLIERHHDVELVAETQHRLVADAQREKNMAAAHDRLISVISVELKPPAHENAREDITGSGDALSSRAADCYRQIYFRHDDPSLAYFAATKLPAGTFSRTRFISSAEKARTVCVRML